MTTNRTNMIRVAIVAVVVAFAWAFVVWAFHIHIAISSIGGMMIGLVSVCAAMMKWPIGGAR